MTGTGTQTQTQTWTTGVTTIALLVLRTGELKMHKLQARVIPDCLFNCIFSIILKLSLHFKIISMPIYSEPQVKTPDDNAFSASIVINFLRLDGARTYFFCTKT